MFKSGNYPYWYNKCQHNGQWSRIDTALECEGRTVKYKFLFHGFVLLHKRIFCLEIHCKLAPPGPHRGMKLVWPGKGNKLNDTVTYKCPDGGFINQPDNVQTSSSSSWDTDIITGINMIQLIRHVVLMS